MVDQVRVILEIMNKISVLALLIFVSVVNIGCMKSEKNGILIYDKKDFEKVVDGKQVRLYTLKNSSGLVCQITNFGGKVVNLWVPDKKGVYADVVLGHDNIDEYLNSTEKYLGATIGRYGNRIGAGKFTLDSVDYTLATNNGANHLHGGNKGYDAVVWDANQIDDQKIELSYLSKDMEEGYPGNLTIKVSYQLTEDNELKVEYWGVTDKTTIVNLTHHSYFNLHGEGVGDITDHQLLINADKYTPVDEGLIPKGVLDEVAGTPMDFTKLTLIGERIENDFEQLKIGLGYDHNWVLKPNSNGLNYAAKVVEPLSGRVMKVFTNEPGVQFYSGNFLNGTLIGKGGKTYNHWAALCLETQHFPDSPNKLEFPSTVLNPDEEYYSICIYKFSANSVLNE